MMISVLRTYIDGFKESWYEKKLIFLIYGIQVLLAYLMTLPVSSMLDKAFSGTTSGQDILQQFDLIAFSWFYHNYLSNINFIRISIIYGVLYLVISTFFAGGIIWLYATKSKFILSDFFSSCVQYFSRFLRLFLVSLLYFVSAIALFGAIGNLFDFFTEDSISEVLPITLQMIKVAFLITLFALINMLFDYAKIITITEERNKMFFVPFESIKFIMMNLIKTTGLYGLYFSSGIILWGIYLSIESVIHVKSIIGIMLFFILTQVYVFIRQWLRLSFFSGQTIFYQNTVTAMPRMLNKEMLEMAVENYEERSK